MNTLSKRIVEMWLSSYSATLSKGTTQRDAHEIQTGSDLIIKDGSPEHSDSRLLGREERCSAARE